MVKKSMKKYFSNEQKITQIGGKVQEDYITFRSLVLFLNGNIVPLYLRLGFNEAEQTDVVLDSILEGGTFAKRRFADYWTERAIEGTVPMERILSANAIKTIGKYTQEEREKKLRGYLSRSLSLRFTEIYKEYRRDFRPQPWTGSRYPVIVFRSSLTLSPSGLVINVNRYLELYGSYMEAYESKNQEQHQEAANAINRFFNGIEITQEELARYFTIEYGAVKPNPKSINRNDYMRLGYKGDNRT